MDIYFVFKRSDGYIGAICSSSRNRAEQVLHTYVANGFEWSYEILFESEDRLSMRKFLEEMRNA